MTSRRVASLVLVCSSLMVLAGCSCPQGFIKFRESCYWFSDIEANFAEARSYCGFLNSRLVVITSEEEDDFVNEIIRNRNVSSSSGYFLGATDLGLEGIWRWEGGLEMKFENWGPGQPDDDNPTSENCLHLWPLQNYIWNDAMCSIKRLFICEKCYR